MSDHEIYPRFAQARLEEALADTPVVLIHGPRQCGKSTLAQAVAKKRGYTYFTFDDENVLRAARADPVGFCTELPERAVLDEVQRIPELFTSIKGLVDRDRRPGRLILTGSANVLLLPKLADSLAGRMGVLRLGPLTQVEMSGRAPGTGFIDRIFGGNFPITTGGRLGEALLQRVAGGGFPAALARTTERRRREWQLQYVAAITQRDLRDLTRIRSLEVLPKLLELAAGQTSRLFNASELAGPFELSRPTIREYLTLLEQVFLIDILPPWHHSRMSRLIKTPKLHLADTGLAAALLGADVTALKENRSLFGQLLETFVYKELRHQSSWTDGSHRFFHYRDKDQLEVDIVLERDGRFISGVEVKASSTVGESDFRGLNRLREATGAAFRCGIVLYDGDSALSFGPQMFAVPIAELWAMRK
ncbi:MAG: ATP-binding protein [Opitutaceae bacterium]